MSFKLAYKSVKQSFKDYAIYFITLVLGVSIFYMFNSVDSQLALLQLTKQQSAMVEFIPWIIKGVSVIVVLILGLLIVFANNFLVNRRKKEFGLFMSLGMSKGQISQILFYEVVLVGLVSLVVGLGVGVLGSQMMSILVANMFEADMSQFTFVFSKTAFIQTTVYFVLMFAVVMMFNTITISNYRLIHLIKANQAHERGRIMKPGWNLFIFILACLILTMAYTIITRPFQEFTTDRFMLCIVLGVIGTFMIFYSFSGLLLFVLKRFKAMYYQGTNMFVLKQLDHKLNSNVASLSIICLSLFFTMSIFATGIGLKNGLESTLKGLKYVDVNIVKTITAPTVEDQNQTVASVLEPYGIALSDFEDYQEVTVYANEELFTYGDFFGEDLESLDPGQRENIMHLSAYNEVARFYGESQLHLEKNEYAMVADATSIVKARNEMLLKGKNIEINGYTLKPKDTHCIDAPLKMNASKINEGVIVVPDHVELPKNMIGMKLFYGTYKESEHQRIEERIQEVSSEIFNTNNTGQSRVFVITSEQTRMASVTGATIVVFVAVYLGLIFMVAASALLALKQLSDTMDYRHQYEVLKNIGCDDKMIKQAIFKQVGLYFMLPLLVATVHSIFGIRFANIILTADGINISGLGPSIMTTLIFMGVVYLIYFMATYSASKQIILERK